MFAVDAASFLVIVTIAAVAGVLAGLIQPRLVVPVVVVEILLGIVIGPDVLGIVESDNFIDFFQGLGLAMLFFFAGYEIDFDRIAGRPVQLAIGGWLLSLALAYALGGALVAAGVGASLLFLGAAMATTAIGTLLPILGDAGEMRTRFGTYLLAAGAAGEFLPVVLVAILFSSKAALDAALILAAFAAITLLAGVFAVRSVGRGWNLLERTLHASSQLPIRLVFVIVFGLVALAVELGIDLLLGGFVAGVIVSLSLRDREVEALEWKLDAVGYGLLIPFFFVVTGVEFDLGSLTDDPVRLLEVPLFLVVFCLVRGAPALLLYRGLLGARDRLALAAFSSTQLPLVVAITTIAVERGHMDSATAASLVGAAVLSTALLPVLGLRLRRDALAPAIEAEGASGR